MENSEAQEQVSTGRTKYRILVRVGVISVLVISIVCIGAVWFGRAIDTSIAETHIERLALAKSLATKGYSTNTLAEWNVSYPPPPDKENAALLYLKAIAAIVPLPDDLRSSVPHVGWFEAVAPHETYSQTTLAAIETHLHNNQAALKLMRDAAAMRACSFPAESLVELMPGRYGAERLGELLRLQIDYATLVGDWAALRTSLRTLDGFSRAFRHDPHLIAGLWELNLRRMYADSIALVLNRMTLSREQLMALRVHRWEKSEGAVWEGSLISGYFLYDRSEEPSDGYYATLADYKAAALLRIFPVKSIDRSGWSGGGLYDPFPIPLPARTKERWGKEISVSFDLEFLKLRVELLDLLDGPASEAKLTSNWHHSLKSQVKHMRPSGYQESQWPSTYPDSLWNTQARVRIVETALALTHYRLDFGEFPANLEALTIAYLRVLPNDPYDGQPIRYVRKDGGYILYCLGENLRDDKGATFSEVSEQRTNGDVEFSVRTR